MPVSRNGLITELEEALDTKTIGDRAATLRRVTDLFLMSSGKLSGEQVALFDDVMGRLLQEIDASARANLSRLLATAPDAPSGVVSTLALDESIDVAGAVLTHSDQIDDATLVEGAKTRSQAHLLAISRRRTLTEAVTDVLVERGDRQVALTTAENLGATFSEFGYSTLVRRSAGDDDLALRVWMRPEVPRQHLLKLVADASESLKQKLANEAPERGRQILEVVAQASQHIHARAREKSPHFAAAQAHVQSLHAAGRLAEAELAEFARQGQFDETTVALSLICDLPIAVIEKAFVDDRSEQIIVIAKAVELSWETVKAILQLQPQHGGSGLALEQAFETFSRLKADTAKKAILFYRLRERANQPRNND